MALRAAAAASCGFLTRRAPGAARASGVTVAARSIATSGRAFMSTSSEIFSAPSFPVKSAYGFEGSDPAVWLQKYPKADPADMWIVGAFPMQDAMRPLASMPEEPLAASAQEDEAALAGEELWDTMGMLSALSEHVPMRDGASRGVDEMLREIDNMHGYFADSVLKKRRKKMNKHKHRKRKKAVRMRTKKN